MYVNPKKSPSEASLWLLINMQGQFTKRTIILFVFTFWYGTTVYLHRHMFHCWSFSIRRCNVKSLEKHFDFDETLNISTYSLVPNERINKTAIIYCKYINNDNEKLLKENNTKYDLIIRKMPKNMCPITSKECDSIEEKFISPGVIISSKKLETIFNDPKTWNNCEDYKYYKHIENSQIYGIICASLSMSLIADRYGRLPTFITCYTCFFIGLLIFLIPVMQIMILANFLTGIGHYGFLIIYMILTEHCDKRRRLIFGTWVLLCIPLSKILAATINLLTLNVKYGIYFNISLITPMPFVIYWYIQEPARYLMYSGNVQKCINILEKNGFQTDANEHVPRMPLITIKLIILRISHPKIRKHHAYLAFFSFMLSIIGNTSVNEEIEWGHIANLGIFLILSAVLKIKRHPVIAGIFDSMVTNFILGTFEIIIIAILSFTTSKKLYGRKHQLFTLFTTMSFIHVFVFAQYDNPETFIAIIFLLVYSLAHAGLYFLFFYYMELYPTRFRATCLGINIIGISLGILIMDYLSIYNLDPLPSVFFPEFVASIMCWLLSNFAHETIEKDIPDNLKEIL